MAAETRSRLGRWADRGLTIVAMVGVLAAIAAVVAPAFVDVSALGGHDWDEGESQRLLVVKSLRDYHQFPFWNPYACGGFSAWGSIQGDTVVVSPFLPFYLFLPLVWALRVEVVGVALLAAVGTWLLAGRFTRSAAARAFACIVFVTNGRWAMQAATGHTWHLYYALTPWVFFFFDRAVANVDRIAWKDTFACAVFVALMVYMGAIYPLPQTGLLVAIYALALAVSRRSVRPLAVGAVVGAVGAGLAAPKLLSVWENISRWPRLTESTEFIDLRAFVELLVDHDQDIGHPSAPVAQWGWHEYGMYIGWWALIAIALGMVVARSERARAMKWVVVAAVALGFGNFHPDSPWAKLHQYPLFSSQHVPSRWLYPATLAGALVAIAAAEQWLSRVRWGRRGLELALLVAVASIATDIAEVSNRAMAHSFWMRLRPIAAQQDYHWQTEVPPELQYAVDDYAPPALPATMANVGVIRCTLHPGLNVWAPTGQNGRPLGMGARGREDPEYRGEAYTASGVGTAALVHFSPNRMEVDVTGAKPGDLLVLNQNWDVGWRANGARAWRYRDAVAIPLSQSSEHVVFTYQSRLFWPGCFLAALVVAVAFGVRRAVAVARSARLRSDGDEVQPVHGGEEVLDAPKDREDHPIEGPDAPGADLVTPQDAPGDEPR